MVKRRIVRAGLALLVLVATLSGPAALGVIAEDPYIHTVKWGETLGWISWRYGVSVKELVEVNNLSSSWLIYAGQELIIPMPPEEVVDHVVQQGESLLSIAAKYDVSIWDIARRNGLWNINLIFVGQHLSIPGGGEEAPAPQAAAPVEEEAIIITSPEMNEEVSTPVTITGWGSGFENTLAVDILDATGNVIGQGYVIVDAEFGQRGEFTGSIEFTAPATAQLGRISVYSISPRDGAIEDLSSITVNLKP